jgi:hypothetical protein
MTFLEYFERAKVYRALFGCLAGYGLLGFAVKKRRFDSLGDDRPLHRLAGLVRHYGRAWDRDCSADPPAPADDTGPGGELSRRLAAVRAVAAGLPLPPPRPFLSASQLLHFGHLIESSKDRLFFSDGLITLLSVVLAVCPSDFHTRGIGPKWGNLKAKLAGVRDPMRWGTEVFTRLLKSPIRQLQPASKWFKQVRTGLRVHSVHCVFVRKAVHAFHLFAPLWRAVDGRSNCHFSQFLACNEETDFVAWYASVSLDTSDVAFAVFLPEFLAPGQFESLRFVLASRFSPIPDHSQCRLLVITGVIDLCVDALYCTDLSQATEQNILEISASHTQIGVAITRFFLVRSEVPGAGKTTLIREKIGGRPAGSFFVNESHQ